MHSAKQALADTALTLNIPAMPGAAEGAPRHPHPDVVYQGWLLKKRRKKLQGMFFGYLSAYCEG